jgi:predicted Fe-S protein YdhL (DUF1289 family)
VNAPPKTTRQPVFPPSPCVDICELNDNDICIGCKRSIAEIAQWSTMTAEEQWRVVHALPERQI